MTVEMISERQSAAPLVGAGGVDEVVLVDGLRRGDRRAAEQFARWLYPRMFAAAKRILHDEQHADDAVQDAFVRTMTSIHQFRGEARFSTWVLRIVVNCALLIRRQRVRGAERSLDDLLPRFREDGHRRDVREPWPDLEMVDLRPLVSACLDELPEEARTIVILRDVLGLSNAESATILGVRSGAAKTRLHRARMALRELVQQRL
jgi:RNA polymerase sigma-70 factor (ECF subfamily)